MTVNRQLKFHALLACIKTRHFALGFFEGVCYCQFMEEGRRESRVQTAYPHCHLLLMTADKLLMQIPSERLQLPHPQPSLALPVQENPASNNPSHHTPYTVNDPHSKIPPLWQSAQSEHSLLNQDNTLLFSHMTAKSNGSSRAGGDCGVHMQPNTCSLAAAILSVTYLL